MSTYKHIAPFVWGEYSQKLVDKILKGKNGGKIALSEAVPGELRVIEGRGGDQEEGNSILITLLVDEHDGIISDAKYQAFGQTPLIAAAEIVCDLLILKTVRQAGRISVELITNSVGGFPKAAQTHIHLVLEALYDALEKARDIEVVDEYSETPLDLSLFKGGEYPNWEGISHESRLSLIQSVIVQDILPYIELDQGGVKIKHLVDLNLTIEYEGNCTSCFASTGSTLTAIQQILRAKVHPSLTVIPHL